MYLPIPIPMPVKPANCGTIATLATKQGPTDVSYCFQLCHLYRLLEKVTLYYKINCYILYSAVNELFHEMSWL